MSRIDGANSSDLNSADYHKPHTVEDITDQNVKTIMHLEDAAKANRDSPIGWQISSLGFAVASHLCGYISFGLAHGL